MPPESATVADLHRRIEAAPGRVRQAVEGAVDAWHGHWDSSSGELEIAVRAGVRTGRWQGQLELAGDAAATHLTLHSSGASYRIDQSSLLLLSIAGLATVPLMLWPLFPRLLSLMPVALMLAVGGWFLVVSRLQNQGPEDFLETIHHLATASEESESPGSASPAP